MINILRCTRRLQITSVTTIFHRPYMKVSTKMEILLKQADHVPRNFEIIYRYPSIKVGAFMYHTVNWFGLTTIGTVLTAWYLDKPETNRDDTPRFLTSPLQSIFLCGCICIIILVAWNMRFKTPIRIYLNPNSNVYRAIFIGKFPFTVEFHEFKKSTMNYVSKDSIFPWRHTLFQANGRKMFLYDEYFRTGADFIDMFKPEEK